MGFICAALGLPPMPHQQEIFDVAGEYDPETLVPFYREIDLGIPRQSGKTVILLAAEIDLALNWGPRQRISYTAQDGESARSKLREDQMPLIQESRFDEFVDGSGHGADRKGYRLANGSEQIIFRNKSRIRALPSTPTAGHGKTVHLAVIDEAFADADHRREQSMRPAMITVASAQLWIASNAGTEDKPYWRSKVELGRVAAERDSGGGLAYFEWSAPDDADPMDEQVWWGCMPALGHTIGLDAIRHEADTLTEDEFRRAYLNQWTYTDNRVIPSGLWAAVCHPSIDLGTPAVVGVDCTPERDAAAVVICDEHGRAELIDCDPGTGWVVRRAVDLASRWNVPVALDKNGPAGVFAAEITEARIPVYEVSGRTFTQACADLYAAIADGEAAIRQHSELDRAAAAVQQRHSGDNWVWSRKSLTTNISPIVALTVARWAALHPANMSLVENVW